MAANSQDNSKRSNPAEHLKKYKFQPGTSENYSGRPKKAISPYYEKQAAKLARLEMSSDSETAPNESMWWIEDALNHTYIVAL